LYSSDRNGASSWQFGHQLPPIASTITLPLRRESLFETTFPLRSGNAKRNGAVGSLTFV
jgi:hypothetical protein